MDLTWVLGLFKTSALNRCRGKSSRQMVSLNPISLYWGARNRGLTQYATGSRILAGTGPYFISRTEPDFFKSGRISRNRNTPGSDCNNILSIWICRVRLSASYPRAQWLRKEYITEHTGWTRQQHIPQSR